MTPYRSWTGPARVLANTLDAAVGAARAADPDAFDAAIEALRRLDLEQSAVVLGAVMQDVLERTHADGMDTEDAEKVLAECIGSVRGWYPQVDEDHLIRALAGALGVGDPQDSPADSLAVQAHGLLLIAQLLSTSGQPLEPLLDAALREVHRAQTVEMP